MAMLEDGSPRIKHVKEVRPYPYIEPKSCEPKWREMAMYGITGWFSNSFIRGEAAVQFGGYFKRDNRDQDIHGELIDCFGRSVIEGQLRLRKKELYFLKKYDGRPEIEYYFERQGNLWVGGYALDRNEGGGKGKSEVMLTKFHNNAFGIGTGPFIINL